MKSKIHELNSYNKKAVSKTKKLILPLFAVFSIVFASCSSIDIVKRHYSDGYYVHINKKKPAVSHEPAGSKKESVIESSSQSETVVSSLSSLENNTDANVNNTFTASSGDAPAVVLNNDSKNTFSFHGNVISDVKAKRIGKKIDRLQSKMTSMDSHSSKGDAPTIVLILLCLFLPFIAVGIVDDWGTRFLISILLTLLFWIPGVIYAFIVCFG